MTRDPVTLSPDTPVADAVEQYFLKHAYGGFPMVAAGRAIDTLSLRRRATVRSVASSSATIIAYFEISLFPGRSLIRAS